MWSERRACGKRSAPGSGITGTSPGNTMDSAMARMEVFARTIRLQRGPQNGDPDPISIRRNDVPRQIKGIKENGFVLGKALVELENVSKKHRDVSQTKEGRFPYRPFEFVGPA